MQEDAELRSLESDPRRIRTEALWFFLEYKKKKRFNAF